MVILNKGLSTPESRESFFFTVVSTTNKNLLYQEKNND